MTSIILASIGWHLDGCQIQDPVANGSGFASSDTKRKLKHGVVCKESPNRRPSFGCVMRHQAAEWFLARNCAGTLPGDLQPNKERGIDDRRPWPGLAIVESSRRPRAAPGTTEHGPGGCGAARGQRAGWCPLYLSLYLVFI